MIMNSLGYTLYAAPLQLLVTILKNTQMSGIKFFMSYLCTNSIINIHNIYLNKIL